MEWLEKNQIQIIPPKRPKKLTGTRFATILGLNPWQTGFEVWCEVTRTYQKPFEDTIYTLAGKAIEPKQIAYMKKAYFMTNLKSPEDIYGADYFKKTWGDFFPDHEQLGGMWDSLLFDADGKPCTVLEFKTTKRAEDWSEDVPEYYALQAALYAYLLGVDDVIMIASFLDEPDYDNPDAFVPSSKNTTTIPFKISERYPTFERKYVKPALKWWKDHVLSGISPAYDEKKDADILKVLRTNTLSPKTDVAAMLSEADTLKKRIEQVQSGIAEDEKRLKVLTEMIKKHAISQFRDGDKKVSLRGDSYDWEISRTQSVKINKSALEADGVLEKYSTTEESYRLTAKVIKED